VFAELAAAVAAHERPLGEVAAALAELDCEASLAEVAAEQGLRAPHAPRDHHVRDPRRASPRGRAGIEGREGGRFIENDCVLAAARPEVPTGFDEVTEARIWLVTGPNMAGKSTFLRQNALITVLGQMGSFVPARSAHIGVVDRLFSRVGAADDWPAGARPSWSRWWRPRPS
jgi:DNA mismatch repair protein MutS